MDRAACTTVMEHLDNIEECFNEIAEKVGSESFEEGKARGGDKEYMEQLLKSKMRTCPAHNSEKVIIEAAKERISRRKLISNKPLTPDKI